MQPERLQKDIFSAFEKDNFFSLAWPDPPMFFLSKSADLCALLWAVFPSFPGGSLPSGVSKSTISIEAKALSKGSVHERPGITGMNWIQTRKGVNVLLADTSGRHEREARAGNRQVRAGGRPIKKSGPNGRKQRRARGRSGKQEARDSGERTVDGLSESPRWRTRIDSLKREEGSVKRPERESKTSQGSGVWAGSRRKESGCNTRAGRRPESEDCRPRPDRVRIGVGWHYEVWCPKRRVWNRRPVAESRIWREADNRKRCWKRQGSGKGSRNLKPETEDRFLVR